jgi:molybdopterin-binding protein
MEPTKKDLHLDLSFPNQFRGKIAEIRSDSTLTAIYVETPSGTVASAIITTAADRLNLHVGDEVIAVCRALDVSLVKI